MKNKLLKQLRKKVKEEVYLTHYYSEDGKLSIILKRYDAIYFYNKDIDMFCTNRIVNYNSIEEALPYLQKARRCFILNVLHSDYRTYSKGQEKRNEIKRLKREDYEKYLHKF